MYAFGSIADWPMFQHDISHTGSTSISGPTTSPNLLWHEGLDSYIIDCSPTVADGMIFQGGLYGHLYAFDAATGVIKWTFNENDNYDFRGSPAVAYGMVYEGSMSGTFYAFDEATGNVVWHHSVSFDSFPSSPTVVGGVVYAGDYNGLLYAFNAFTGAVIWSYSTGGPIYGSPAVSNGVVYIGSYYGSGSDANFHAINAATGNLLWSFDAGAYIRGSPSVSNGVVYFGDTWGNTMYARDATTGAEVWTITAGGSIDAGTAVVARAGGSGSYSNYQWFVDSTSAQTSASTTFTYYPSSTGTHSISVVVTDSLGAISGQSSPASVNVAAVQSVSISPIISSIQTGYSQTFTASATGGSGSLTYQWYVNDALRQTSGTTYNFHPTSTGSYAVYCKVIDSASTPESVYSNEEHVDATSAPTVVVSPNTWKIDLGQSQQFTATPSGGSGAYTGYQWYVDGVAQSGATASTFNYAPGATAYSLIGGATSSSYSFATSSSTAAGNWNFILQTTDNAGAATNSTALMVAVMAGTSPTPTPTATPTHTVTPTARPKPAATPTPTPSTTPTPTPTPTSTPTGNNGLGVEPTQLYVVLEVAVGAAVVFAAVVWYKRSETQEKIARIQKI